MMRKHTFSPRGTQARVCRGSSEILQKPSTRPDRRSLSCCAQQNGYKAPSSGASSTELEALSKFSTVVPDTYLMQDLQKLETPKAATVTSAVLSGILSSPTGFREYEVAIQRAVGFEGCVAEGGDEKYACVMDKALANVGALFASRVEGSVSTEVDARLAYNTDGLVSRGQNIAEHYKEMKIDRFLLRIPGTWEGIQAVKKLEAEGIPCHVTLVYSFTQAAAAAQAGASVIQPNIGRLKDWYTKHPGFVKDPKGPREDSGFSSDVNPGIQLVERIFNYCAKLHPKTKVMVSGIRRKQDALLLAGVDYLVVGPKVLEELNSQYTMGGYNDGLSANATFDETDVVAKLSKERADSVEFAPEETAKITKQLFQDGLGQAGLELLEEGIKGLKDDVARLEPDFKNLAVGSF